MMKKITTDVCIVGAGPAGMVLGLLLANRGVDVTVLERNKDFAREYRGEVLQPAFLNLMNEIGLLDLLMEQPHAKLTNGNFYHKDRLLGHIKLNQVSQYPYAMWMPQPIMLQAFYEVGQTLSTFHFHFRSPVKELQKVGEKVTGVIVQQDSERLEIDAKIVVGTDGRNSTVSRLGGFEHLYSYYNNDIAWFTIERPENWNSALRIQFTDRNLFIVLPKYPHHLQAGLFLPKGEWEQIREKSIEEMKNRLRESGGLFTDFAEELTTFSSFHLLQSRIFFVREWAQDGCLLVGDAAHCASPVGAIGVTLSVATALEAAKVIIESLEKADYSKKSLRRVQERRSKELQWIHRLQRRIEFLVSPSTRFLHPLRPHVIPLVFRSGIATHFLQKVLVDTGSISMPTEFRFSKNSGRIELSPHIL